jgi:hypothetical protein
VLTDEIVDMATCTMCAMQIEITTLLAGTSTQQTGEQT